MRRAFLVKACKRSGALQATDEAAVAEAAGGRLALVPHAEWNPKLTTWTDYELLEAYLGRGGARAKITRTGFGTDLHRLVAGREFYLGSVRIPFERGPMGHSDGDALLHAIADAVLGVLGAGDIGEWFSDRDARLKAIRSSKILDAVMAEAGRRGWRPVHLDAVIQLERPRLGRLKDKIKSAVAALMGMPADAVSIKAKTAEGLGPVGEGRAVACEALVTMEQVPQ
jgi:2-C-methyl-D-erythritol 2,4-cyclodiphosphate synthase